MRTTNGGLTHDIIMKLTWRQFNVYLDASTWINNEQSEDGQRKNKVNDLNAQGKDPMVQKIIKALKEDTDRRMEPHRKRHGKGKIVKQKKIL